MEENWKDVLGYEGYYQVSNKGRVKSMPRTVEFVRNGISGLMHVQERIMSFYTDPKGYIKVMLCGKNKRIAARVHILIAQAFIPNPNNYENINHINFNKADNDIKNLEWSSIRENCTHRSLRMASTSKYNGVCWDSTKGKWLSQSTIKKKHYFLGYHTEELDAAHAYNNFLKSQGLSNKYSKF